MFINTKKELEFELSQLENINDDLMTEIDVWKERCHDYKEKINEINKNIPTPSKKDYSLSPVKNHLNTSKSLD